MLRILGSVSIMLNYNEKSVINTSNLTINRITTTKREKNAEHGFQNHISTWISGVRRFLFFKKLEISEI